MSSSSPAIISYILLRKLVGWLGILLPVILVIGTLSIGGEDEVRDSISAYYYSNMRDVFVGILCAVAVFLFAYKGYDKKDQIAGNLASVFALGVAFFPTTEHGTTDTIGAVHLVSAILFFLTLSYFSLFLFTQSNLPVEECSDEKKNRNLVYKICGFVMVLCLALIAVYMLLLEEKYPALANYDPVFWLEVIALWAFGVSWLTKGQFLLKDSN